MYNYTLMSSSSSSKVAVPVVKQRSLLLKHEILSPECDLFRACLPRRLFVKRLGRLMALVVVMVVGHWWFRVRDVWVSLLMIVSTLFIIFFMLSQAIEERILFIRGLGVQYTVKNGFGQETTNFYPFELIKSFYIFESFDGLKTGHFFTLKLEKEGNIVFFENMRPPVEFLKRVYRKFVEITTE